VDTNLNQNKTGNVLHVECNIEVHSCNHCCSGKATSITDSECAFLALVIHHKICIHDIVLSSVACPAPQYFSTLSHKWYDFREKTKFIAHKICIFIFSTTFASNISHSARYHKCTYVGLQAKYPLFLSDSN
jgi:hypothetical protein